MHKSGVKWRDLMRRLTQNPEFYTVVPVAAEQRADAGTAQGTQP